MADETVGSGADAGGANAGGANAGGRPHRWGADGYTGAWARVVDPLDEGRVRSIVEEDPSGRLIAEGTPGRKSGDAGDAATA